MAAGTKDDPLHRRLEQATSHPLRKEILEQLEKHPMSLSELAEILGKPPRVIRHHFRVLASLGYMTIADPTGA